MLEPAFNSNHPPSTPYVLCHSKLNKESIGLLEQKLEQKRARVERKANRCAQKAAEQKHSQPLTNNTKSKKQQELQRQATARVEKARKAKQEHDLLSKKKSTFAPTADYVAQLFPSFDDDQIRAAVENYENIGLGTIVDQTIAVMGECRRFHLDSGNNFLDPYALAIFICPTYRLLSAFPG